MYKLDWTAVEELRALRAQGVSLMELASKFNISPVAVWNIAAFKRWKRTVFKCQECSVEIARSRGGPNPQYCPKCRQKRRNRTIATKLGHLRYEEKTYTERRIAHRRWNLEARYGVTLEVCEMLAASQDYRCALCGVPEASLPPIKTKWRTEYPRHLHLDHCHSTNRVRALLCPACNKGLGSFRDNVAVIRRAANYLEAHAGIEFIGYDFDGHA
jgi:hypothetical protein